MYFDLIIALNLEHTDMSTVPDTKFDPSKLSGGIPSAPKSAPKSDRVIMAVDHYLTPPDGFHFAVGHRVDAPDELVKVRLNTVPERHQDKPKLSLESITSLYVTSDTPRETIADKAKNNIKLISFDDAKLISRGEDGVAEYRAHWPKTMSSDPKSELMMGMAHIKLSPAGEGKKSQAYVELIKSSTLVDQNNVDAVMADALSISDGAGRARDPIMIVRIAHEGKVVATPRIYPATETTQVFDQQTGGMRDRSQAATADKSISALMDGGAGKSDIETISKDRVRAVIAGIKGLDEPTFTSADAAQVDNARNMYYGAKSGDLKVEILAVEKIDFGADTRVNYVNDRTQPHLAAYTIKEPVAEGQKTRETPGFANTVLVVNRHPDGEPYAVFATPVALYPKMTKLADLPMSMPEPSSDNTSDKNVKKESGSGLEM